MKKKYIVLMICGCVILAGIGLYKMNSYSYSDALKDAKNIESYEFVTQMEMIENDEMKSFQVTSTYARIKDQDYYKVELYDKSINLSQIIVRNNEGVFVLTPSLNQVFQFQSDWPKQSSKPYIYQSLISFLDECKHEKIKEGYQVIGDIEFLNDKRIKKQEIIFDKHLYPKRVILYDENNETIVKCETTSFKTNLKLSQENFKTEALMNADTSTYNQVSSMLPMYPVALMGSVLEKEEVSSIDETLNHILRFTGDKSFTIVQSPLNVKNEMEVTKIDTDMIELLDGFAYVDHGQLTLIESGIVSSIYSNDLNEEEKLSVLSSMQSAQVK